MQSIQNNDREMTNLAAAGRIFNSQKDGQVILEKIQPLYFWVPDILKMQNKQKNQFAQENRAKLHLYMH